MDIGLQILGARTIDLRFTTFPEAARTNLIEAITQSTAELYEAIEARIPKKTGKLAASIRQRVTQGASKITGIVAVTGDFPKAGALEYGTHRTIDMKLSHVFSHLIQPIEVKRTLNIEAHSFMRGPEEDMAPTAFARMQEAVSQAVDSD